MLELKSEFGVEPVTVCFLGSNYMVYSDGKVFSQNRNTWLNMHDNGKGYLTVNLFNQNTKGSIKQYIHRLVAFCYIPNPDNLTDVNHIDFDKSNNTVANLEWMSRKENMQHAWSGDRFTEKKQSNQKVRDAWLGQIVGNRKIIEITDEVSPSSNYYVITECLLCGNSGIKMAQNDFKKGKSKCCSNCRYNKAP